MLVCGEGKGVGLGIFRAQIKLACNVSLPHSAPGGAVRHRAVNITETLLPPLGLFMMKRVGEILLSRHLSGFHVRRLKIDFAEALPSSPRELTRASVDCCVFKTLLGDKSETMKGGRAGVGRGRQRKGGQRNLTTLTTDRAAEWARATCR